MLSLINALALFPIGLGVWSFFIEPNTLSFTYLKWTLNDKSKHLSGIRLAHISDLHFKSSIPQRFLDKINRKISEFNPDIILFSGDFLCHANLENEYKLKKFLNNFSPKIGAFCILGNHDYAEYVSRNEKGIIDIIKPGFFRTSKRMITSLIDAFRTNDLRNEITEHVKTVGLHERLCNLLKETPFQLLNNQTTVLPLGLNIVGLEELLLARCDPARAFTNYNHDFPGIILVHNPDAIPLLANYPGDWIFAGHTHGQQIYIPWTTLGKKLSEKLTGLQHPEFCRGLVNFNDKHVYINRGLGGFKRIRFNSTPEICFIECKE